MKFHHLFLALAIINLIIASLVACGDDDDDDDNSGGTGDGDGDNDDASGETWTDPTSGLTWQAMPSSDSMYWDDAKAYCDNLSLAGGGWHLPTISELRTLIRGCDGTATGGPCGVTDECLDSSCLDESCYGCEYGGGSGCYGPAELQQGCQDFWSSSPVTNLDGSAWHVDFRYGDLYGSDVWDDGVRCVR